jgi:hypothetical protein
MYVVSAKTREEERKRRVKRRVKERKRRVKRREKGGREDTFYKILELFGNT